MKPPLYGVDVGEFRPDDPEHMLDLLVARAVSRGVRAKRPDQSYAELIPAAVRRQLEERCA